MEKYCGLVKIVFEGHEYLVDEGYRKGGICHSESCPCKKRQNG